MLKITNSSEWNQCFNLLLEDDVSEIESNGPNQFFMKRKGIRSHIDNIVLTEEQYLDGIKNSLTPFVKSHNEYDPEQFLFEGRLEFTVNGKEVRGRCHIVLPPASDYPQITIAKKNTSLVTVDKIASGGSMSTEMMSFLLDAVKADLTLVISGQTGAGKTTLLEALSKEIKDDIRIGVAEDTPELRLIQSNVSYLNATPWSPGMSENDVATLDWVVKQFQRMRTDKLIIGETRGKEFADFLIAANSGMDGSMTTIHANDPRSCLKKMTNFALRGSPNIPVRAINSDISSAIDIVVQLIYIPSQGLYRVSAIEEITQTLGNNDDALISTQTLYSYNVEDDTFNKDSIMTDVLRKKFEKKGIDIQGYVSGGLHKHVQPHGRRTNSSSTSRIETPDSSVTNLRVNSGAPVAPKQPLNRRVVPNNPFAGKRL